MIQARSLTAEGAEFLAQGAEKNSFRVPLRKPLRIKDPTSFFEQDSKVKTSHRDEMFIDKAAPEILRHPGLAIARNIRAPTEPLRVHSKISWRPSAALPSSAKTSPSSAVKVLPYGATSYSGFGMPLSQ